MEYGDKPSNEKAQIWCLFLSNVSFPFSNISFLSGDLCEPDCDFQVLKDAEYLKARLAAAGYGADGKQEKEVIASCGSGVTACYIALAIDEIGGDMEKVKVYDGSWSEFGLEGDSGGGDIEVGRE